MTKLKKLRFLFDFALAFLYMCLKVSYEVI